MNFNKMFLGGAVALSLTFAVGSASADDIQFYGATFESAVSTTPDEMNDWAYALDSAITAYADTMDEPYGWFGGADDSTFDTAAEGAVTQSVTATFSPTEVTAKFFTAKIEFDIPEEPFVSCRETRLGRKRGMAGGRA